jgi:aspartate beta-hydroxylase
MTGRSGAELVERLQRAKAWRETSQVLQAELLYIDILKSWPANEVALASLAELALERGDVGRAVGFLETAVRYAPGNQRALLNLAVVYVQAADTAKARQLLEAGVKADPFFFAGWLLLGQVLEKQGDASLALKSYFKAVAGARSKGLWLDEATTPPSLLPAVLHANGRLRRERRELLFGAYEDLRVEFGTHELRRVDRALSGYLHEWNATPTDGRQRPKFFYFPDLPTSPFVDPFLQPWARQLQLAFPEIRDEALRVWNEDQKFQNFLDISEHGRMDDYVRANGKDAAWEAFFFYRHGERFESNHVRCPQTSAILEGMDLCRIADHAPEICFSVLKPATHILPHYGVSNVRLVMHLPLLVPSDCALRLIDEGVHHWREGELVMFDDTFKHEAWNRSAQTRIVLLMDCWNPHLTQVERTAVKQLIEMMGRLHRALHWIESGDSP